MLIHQIKVVSANQLDACVSASCKQVHYTKITLWLNKETHMVINSLYSKCFATHMKHNDKSELIVAIQFFLMKGWCYSCPRYILEMLRDKQREWQEIRKIILEIQF